MAARDALWFIVVQPPRTGKVSSRYRVECFFDPAYTACYYIASVAPRWTYSWDQIYFGATGFSRILRDPAVGGKNRRQRKVSIGLPPCTMCMSSVVPRRVATTWAARRTGRKGSGGTTWGMCALQRHIGPGKLFISRLFLIAPPRERGSCR